jgi:hypothetical protein
MLKTHGKLELPACVPKLELGNERAARFSRATWIFLYGACDFLPNKDLRFGAFPSKT